MWWGMHIFVYGFISNTNITRFKKKFENSKGNCFKEIHNSQNTARHDACEKTNFAYEN